MQDETLTQAMRDRTPQIPADPKKKPALLGLVFHEWCRKPESNRHGVLHRQILNLLRLPISPLRQEGEGELWHSAGMTYPTIEDAIGHTPLVALQRIGAQHNADRGNVILGKLEGNNPAGSVKDRPAISMIKRAEERGEIKPGDRRFEPLGIGVRRLKQLLKPRREGLRPRLGPQRVEGFHDRDRIG